MRINIWENELACDECANKDIDDEAYFLPIVNSPRCGVCGYVGETDKWTFDPQKLLPKP